MEAIEMRKILAVLVMAGALAAGFSFEQQKGQQEVALQAAIRTETVEGNLKGAIEAYKKIAEGSNRAIAARALVRMGQCYEKLGDAEASKAYQRVVREFADQKEAVEQARALLAASSRDRQSETGIIEQQKWVLPDGRTTLMRHPSPDGRYLPFQVTGERSLWLHDLTTGEDRKVIEAEAVEYVGSPELSPDGKQIAYTRQTRQKAYELRISDIDGSRMRVLMSDKERWLWPKAWSPDAKHILILMQSATTGWSNAMVSVADGSMQVLAAQQNEASNGCFSPDGKYVVAYPGSVSEGQTKRGPGALKLIPTDGSAGVPLFESSATNWAPFWTPDGRNIVFLSDRSGTVGLWSIRMNGGKPEGDSFGFSATSWNQYRKSSEVNGWPSDHLCPSRSRSVKIRPSSTLTLSRMSGTSAKAGV